MGKLGFFSEYLAIGMSGERLTSKELARKLGCSYEYVRAFVQGRSLPSARLQSRLCKVFGWSETKLRRLVILDQMRRQLGDVFWEQVGVEPESRFRVLRSLGVPRRRRQGLFRGVSPGTGSS